MRKVLRRYERARNASGQIVEGVGELYADLGFGGAVEVAPLVTHIEDYFVTLGGNFCSLGGFVFSGGNASLGFVAQDETLPAFVTGGG